MPLALALTYAPAPLRLHTNRISARRRLRALVDAAIPGVETLWQGLFHDLRQAVSVGALAAALAASHLLDAYSLLADLWHREVDAPARRLLPVLLTAVLDDAAVLTSDAWVPGLDETTQAVDAYVGAQVLAISATTMATVLHVLRATAAEDIAMPARVRRLRESLALTPRQQGSIERLRARLTEAGTPARQIAREVRVATERGLTQRAQQISLTEVHTAAHLGAYDALQQQIRTGVIDGEQVRRYWIVQTDERLCAVCAEVPRLNPEGVAADAPFETPLGPVLYPSLHPNCRCDIDVHIAAEGG